MGTKLDEFKSDTSKERAEIHVDYKEEMFYIKYFDENGTNYYTTDLLDKSLSDVRDIALNWAVAGDLASLG